MNFEDCKRKLDYCASQFKKLKVIDDPELWVTWSKDGVLYFRRGWTEIKGFSITPYKDRDEVLEEATTWLLDHINHLRSMKEVPSYEDLKSGMKVGRSKVDIIGTVKTKGNLRDYENSYDRTFYLGEEPSEAVQLDRIITKYQDDQYIKGFVMDVTDFPKNRIKVDRLIPWDDLEELNLKVYSE